MTVAKATPRPIKSSDEAVDVLCLGEVLVDFFADPVGAELWAGPTFRPHLGGAPANMAVGLARQGMRVGLMTMVGKDAFGQFLRERLITEGVDVSRIREHAAARTGVTFVSVDAAGERSFLFYRHPSADLCMEADDVDAADVARAKVLHVGSSTLSREPARAATWRALDAAAERGVRVSCDVNLRPHLWPDRSEMLPQVSALLRRSWLAKLSAEEIDLLLGTTDPREAARRVRELGPTIAVVTVGSDGCWFASADLVRHSPAVPVTAVDTTGAGDAFMSTLVAALLREVALDEACRRANQSGARACTAVGATTAR
jgi:fructokinase